MVPISFARRIKILIRRPLEIGRLGVQNVDYIRMQAHSEKPATRLSFTEQVAPRRPISLAEPIACKWNWCQYG
jgi:hypothetical protein